jgi:hypothetical protein
LPRPPPKRRFNPNVRRALVLLANSPHGAAEELLTLGHDFKRELLAGLVLAGLVLAGLATVVTETMKAGAATITIERYMITDDGRKALES